MQRFENQKFEGFDDRDSAARFDGIEFRRCQFDYCLVSITREPSLRSTIRNVRLVDCATTGGSIGCAIVEDSMINNFKSPGLVQTFGAVFKHVVLQGRFDRLMICNYVNPRSDVNPPYQYDNVYAFRDANAEYYRQVDWALDISQGEFKELDIRGVPGKLIRRDPDTQVLILRERLLQDDWRDLPFKDSLTPFSLGFTLKQGLPDLVLIAPKRHRKFPLYLEDLRLLRKAGVAEPN